MLRYSFQPVDRCDMCGSDRFRLHGLRLNGTQGVRPRRASGIAVSVKQCRDCGLIFADPLPVPASIDDHYGMPPEEFWKSDAFDWTPEYFAREIDVAKRLIGFKPGMKALDVGVGLGKAMQSLTHAGFDAWGIEPSTPFHQRAVERLGTDRIQLAAVENADFPEASFDFITFGAVLEHLYSPSAALERVARWLKPGGIIQAEVPNARHLMSRLINLYYRLAGTTFVTNISPMHPPFHLYEFTLDSFRDYEVAEHFYQVCAIAHVPEPLHPPLRWWMKRNDTGMQLTVFLRPWGASAAGRR